MNYKQSTGISIQDSFELFHELNPKVYLEFRKLALEAINLGKTKISFKLLINKIRWDVFIATVEPTLFDLDGKVVKFKINDAYSSRYARLFAKDFPQYSDRIEFRRLRS